MTACGTESSEPTNSCGTLFVYDKKTEATAAQEYQAMTGASVYPVTRMFMDDYGATRATIRACGK